MPLGGGALYRSCIHVHDDAPTHLDVELQIRQIDYAYNKVHDRTHESYAGTGLGDAFAYDKLRRLTTAWMGSSNVANPGASTYVKKLTFNMDDDANRTSVVDLPYGGSSTTTNYTTNNLNSYTNVGGTTRGNDANGNLTDNGTHLFSYNYKNVIVQVKLKSGGGVVADYKYDALGRRVEKDVGGAIERHIRSPVSPEVSHVVCAYGASDTWMQDYVWSDEIDGIIMLRQADVLDFDADSDTSEVTRSYYHRNALGSVMGMTDAAESAIVSYRYSPYGVRTTTVGGVVQTSDPLGQPWTFTSRASDAETSLLYYRARSYDPKTGRFLQRDPLGYEPHANLYVYANSNPVGLVDPTGLDPVYPFPMPPTTQPPPATWPPKTPPARRDPSKKPSPSDQPKPRVKPKKVPLVPRILGAIFMLASPVGEGSENWGNCSCLLRFYFYTKDNKVKKSDNLVAKNAGGCLTDAECFRKCRAMAHGYNKEWKSKALKKSLKKLNYTKIYCAVEMWACFSNRRR